MRAVHWFRNDLRLHDNTALAAAARSGSLALVFVLDFKLLRSSGVGPPRLRFLFGSLARLNADLGKIGQSLIVRRGDPAQVITQLLRETRADLLTFNRDYSPYARRRDERVRSAAERSGVRVLDFKDRVVFESSEVRTNKGDAFRVFTPFRNAWLRRADAEPPSEDGRTRLPPAIPGTRGEPLDAVLDAAIDDIDPAIRLDRTDIPTPGEAAANRRLRGFLSSAIEQYHLRRNLPAIDGTSRLSPYLRMGVLSIRTCMRGAQEAAGAGKRGRGARTWIDELIWREFYNALLWDNPYVLREAFRPEYASVRWNDDREAFAAWCQGQTGFPFVDAAMRQLLRTGWMHNRARMVVASFLTKDLLVDWRWGERFFMRHLVDGDPASNSGGWQWAASTGSDAQPYFRVFNPVLQSERFDPDGAFVRRQVAELAGLPSRFIHRPWDAPSRPAGYPAPIVDHAARREQAIERFREARARHRRR